MRNRILLLIMCFLAFANNIFSQCAMCKAVVETNLEAGDTKGAGLNDGILFLMATPYLLIFTFGVFFYIHKRKETEKI